MAHAIRVKNEGGPNVLQYETVVQRRPGEGEVWLRQEAMGINYLDVTHRNGAVPLNYPSGLGVEAAGVVEEIGAGVESVALGDRVVYALGPVGAYADGRLYPANRLVKLPDDISTHDAAAIFLKGLTAHYLLTSTYAVGPGTDILLYGVGGGLGQIAAPWATALGANVIGVVSKQSSVDRAKASGCEHVIVWEGGDLPSKVMELTGGRGVDVVYDGIGRETFDASLDSLRKRGTLVSIGASSGLPEPVSLARLNKGSFFLTRPGLADHISDESEYQARAQAVFEAVRTGVIKPMVRKSFALKNASEAHTALQSGQVKGTVLLIP